MKRIFLIVALIIGLATSAYADTKASVMEFLLSQVRTSAGGALVGGKAYFYTPGTTTPKAAYSDKDKASPIYYVVLDANATAQVYGAGIYRIIIKDAAGVTRFDRDNITFESQYAYVNADDYGGLSAAVTALGSTATTLLVNSNQTISADTTIPTTMSLRVEKGAVITVNTSKTLAINGAFQAGIYQVFNLSGTGTVTFGNGSVDSVYPEWWGSFTGLVSDTSAGFNMAINAGQKVILQPGTYLVNAVHTSGYPVVQGAGMGVTYIKSYSASGYAWTESVTDSSWNTHLVMNDLSILGTGSRNGFVFGDPVTYSTDITSAGRCIFNSVSFQGCVIGFNKPWGNLGNTFNRCYFAGNSYGYWGVENAVHPMPAGEDIFNNCSFTLNTLAALYSSSIQGVGQIIINNGNFQLNPGFAIFVDGYTKGYTPLRLNNVWFEGNATVTPTAVNGTSYPTRDIYLHNVAYALFDGCNFTAASRQLVNSTARETNCNYNTSPDFVDATSTLLQDNINTWNVHSPTSALVQSVAKADVGFGTSYGSSWLIPERSTIVGGYTRLGASQYNGTVAVTTYDFDAATATTVADGVLYDTCAELTMPNGTTCKDKTANGLISYTSGRYYVWSMDVKLVTAAIPTTMYFLGTGGFNRDISTLLVQGKWVTVGGVVKADATANAYAPYIINTSGSPVTLRMSAVQVVEFLTEADAINYFNARLYRHL
jgi:hypothetical protein